MAANMIREPQQKRSIEKKKRITEAGINLICKNGYYNTTTADIAKAAHVSTGIVYSYFKDKNDILIYGLEALFMQIEEYLFNSLKPLHFERDSDFIQNLNHLLDTFVAYHVQFQKPHQELQSLASTNPDVDKIVRQFENTIILKMTEACLAEGISHPHLAEKIHIIYNIVESYCHEIVFNKKDTLDYDAVKLETIHCIYYFLFDTSSDF